jgi:vacuolar protein sorting-associated protein 13A/C
VCPELSGVEPEIE